MSMTWSVPAASTRKCSAGHFRSGGIDYYVVTTGEEGTPGINGGMLPRRGGSGDRVIAWVSTVGVDDLDATMTAVEANGGSIALAKEEFESVGWLAYAKDTEGNIFGMIEDNSAS
jgi:predicted enzyme related to lactoylglutathione lyase